MSPAGRLTRPEASTKRSRAKMEVCVGGHKIEPSELPSELENELGEVRACECGGVQLCMGPMTLHFAADDADKLLELAGAAKALVDDHRRRREARGSSKSPKRTSKAKAHGTLH